ncbi:MAG: sugar kinase [Mycobacteriales bacterium]
MIARVADRIVVVGDIAVDIVARFTGALNVGSDSPATVSMSGGGSAANVATWLASLRAAPGSAGVVYVGRVGNDSAGRTQVDALSAAGVDVRAAIDLARPTGAVVVLVGDDGERTMFPDRGANAALSAADLPDDVFRRGSHLHVSGYSLLEESSRAAALAALERARAAGMTISVDPSSAAPLRALGAATFLEWTRGADLCIANLAEASELAGDDAPGELARRLASSTYREVVIKLGAEGAVWSDGDTFVSAPAVTSRVVDTTGAGDAFAAGFLSSWVTGAPAHEALAAGAGLAAIACATVGGRPPMDGTGSS